MRIANLNRSLQDHFRLNYSCFNFFELSSGLCFHLRHKPSLDNLMNNFVAHADDAERKHHQSNNTYNSKPFFGDDVKGFSKILLQNSLLIF